MTGNNYVSENTRNSSDFFSNTLFYYFSLVYNCNYNADIHRCAKSKAKKCNTQKKGTET